MTGHVPRIKARLTLPSYRRVLGLLEGRYAATVTGRGLELNDLREYVRGDEVKDLDWKASARTGTMLVRRYVAHRRHTVLLVLSTGRTMAAAHSLAGSTVRAKRDVAVELAGTLGWLAVRQGDAVGVAYGDAGGRHGVPARAGEAHLERCLSAAYDAVDPGGAPADLAALLIEVTRTVRRRAIVLVVADDETADDELLAAVRRLLVQHEVLVVTVGDIDPVGVPVGFADLVDVESGRGLPAWLRGDARLARELADERAEQRRDLHRTLTRAGAVHVHHDEELSTIAVLQRLLARAQHDRRH